MVADDPPRLIDLANASIFCVDVNGIRKGTKGVSTNGVIANNIFFDRGTFWYSR